MANPWDNDPIVSAAPQQGGIFTPPPNPQTVRQNERQDRNDARVASNEQQRIALERARLNADLQSKGLTFDASGNVIPLPSTVSANPGLNGDAYLKTLSPTDAAQVKALAEGRFAFPTGRAASNPYWQHRIEQVSQYDPSFDAINYNARAATRRDFTSGTSSRNIKALNTALGHLGALGDQISGTASHSFTPLNRLENFAARTAGSSGITKFEQTAGALASELTQVFRGTGGAEADIQRYLNELDSSASEEQKKAAVANIAGLLKSRLDALGDQYTKGMGTAAGGLDVLDPHAKKVLQTYLPGFTGDGGAGSNGNPPVIGPGGGAPPAGPTGGGAGGSGGTGGTGGGAPPATPWDQSSVGLQQPAGGATRSVYDPQTSAGLDSLVRSGRPYAEAAAFAQSKGFAPPSAAQYAAAQAYAKNVPSYTGGFTDARRDVPTTLRQQAAASPMGSYAVGAGDALTLGLDDEAAGALSKLTGGDYTQGRDAFNANKSIMAASHPGANMLGNVTGGVIGAIGGGEALAGTKAAGMFGRVFGRNAPLAADTLYGGAYGAGENNDNRLIGGITGAAVGAGAGAGTRSLVNGIGNVIAPPAGEFAPAYAQGVYPTIGQRFSQSKFMGGVPGRAVNTFEQAMQSVPVLGSLVARARQIPRDQFQLGGFNDALAQIGQTLPEGTAPGTAPHAFTAKAFGDAYDAARSGMQFVPDKPYMSDLDAFIQKLQSGLLSKDQAEQVAKFANNTVGSRLSAAGGKLDGPAYQQAGTEMSNAISQWGKDPTTQPMAGALSDYQTIFDNAARRNSDPAAVNMLDNADAGWARYVRLRNAAARGGVRKEAGTFSPADLLAGVKQEAGGVKSGAYLRGDALSQDYANAGRGLIDTLPNSGTSERLMTGQALGGGLGAATGAGSAVLANPGVLAPFAAYAPGINTAVTRFIAPREATLSPEIAAILANMAGKIKDRRGMFGNALAPAAVGYATSP